MPLSIDENRYRSFILTNNHLLYWAGCATTAYFGFSYRRTSKTGFKSRGKPWEKGTGKCSAAGSSTTTWGSVVGIWSQDEISGGLVAKADNIFASEFGWSTIDISLGWPIERGRLMRLKDYAKKIFEHMMVGTYSLNRSTM